MSSLKNFTIESILSNNHNNVKVAMNKNYVRCFKNVQQNIMLAPTQCFARIISMPLHSFHVFPSLSLLNKHSGKYNFERSKENKGNQKKENQNTIKCKARRQSL
uniref:Uncharacterized protein n=1 Tax=Meloidogyne enterolobii TaxID=390850 RepID=A0A6V7UFH1_MELEN|nr:unnamed protein product [Meloidogyne enterolobii]